MIVSFGVGQPSQLYCAALCTTGASEFLGDGVYMARPNFLSAQAYEILIGNRGNRGQGKAVIRGTRQLIKGRLCMSGLT